MRASVRGTHLSGAERIVNAGQVGQVIDLLVRRAVSKDAKPDEIVIASEPLDTASIRELVSLDLFSRSDAPPEEARSEAVRILATNGVSHDAATRAIRLLSEGPSRSRGTMRGAMILDAATGERLEPDHDRGVRASRFDWTAEASEAIDRKLSLLGLTHFRTREALALATKVAHAPGIIAELCWSDDPDYVSGYVASPSIGYVRFPRLKQQGERMGGRAFFVRREGFDRAACIRYLEDQPVLISRSGICRAADYAAHTAVQEREPPMLQFKHELLDLKERHLYRFPRSVSPSKSSSLIVDGRELLQFSSNDYLGLSGHPALREAAARAMRHYGFGSGASRLISGTSPLHVELEQELAAFKHAGDAVLFNSGYAANTGVIPALTGEGDAIFSDSLNHASIIDGCRLSGASVHIYRHRDAAHLESLLKSSAGVRKKLIVTDGVFSMDGDIAPLPALVELAERYNALLMLDDAHATGVLGPSGRGVAEHFGVEDRVHIRMGTLGKALGSFGAYVAGDRALIDLLRNRARSFLYSTALPPAVCAASLAALAIVRNEPDRRARLWRNRERFVRGLGDLGILTAPSETPIVPLLVGSAERTLVAGKRLFDLGIFAVAIRPPTVPEGRGRIRATITALHTDDEIDRCVEAIGILKKEGFF